MAVLVVAAVVVVVVVLRELVSMLCFHAEYIACLMHYNIKAITCHTLHAAQEPT